MTPSMEPVQETTNFRDQPATRNMMTSVRKKTQTTVARIGETPLRQSGTTSFQTARQLKTKETNALRPVSPAKQSKRRQNSPKSRAVHPMR